MLSHPWRPVPLFRAALPFTAGIVMAMAFPCRYTFGIILSVSCLLVPAVFVYIFSPRYFRFYVIQGCFLQMVCCMQGYTTVLLTREDLRPGHHTRTKAEWCKIRLEESPALKGKYKRAIANVLWMGDSIDYREMMGMVLCYFPADSQDIELAYGDELIVPNTMFPIPVPKIPGDFNYRSFMEKRQVYGKMIVTKKLRAGSQTEFSIKGTAIACRQKLLGILREKLDGQEFAVAAALLIGEDDFVDKSLMNAFTATGTLHVLSVSGMHVGLIYMLLALVLGNLEKRKNMRLFYYLVLYGFLWSYAFITGLSAPVVRSAMMLSLVLSGKLLERKSPVLNTLTGSFLLLMMINPYWIAETGFQLSYLAVFGIMSLHPLLVQQMDFSKLWLHRIWELVSVSLCAQLITVPVGLYYFGQFPVYFLISNLVIIPVSTLAIYGGIAVLVTDAIPYAGTFIAFLESQLLKLLNAITIFLGGLPGAVTNTGKISLLNCLVLYLILYTTVRWLQARSANALKSLLLTLILWSVVVLFRL